MIALTVRQPWASLIVHGIKTIETRTWNTKIRGLVAIHAASFDYVVPTPVESGYIYGCLMAAKLDPGTLPRGAIIGTACIVDSRSADGGSFPSHEIPLGNFGPRHFAWDLMHAMTLSEPLPAKGKLGFWCVPDALADAIHAQCCEQLGPFLTMGLCGPFGIAGQPTNGNPELN